MRLLVPCLLTASVLSAADAAPAAADRVARGAYLATQVAMCTDCHSQRGRDGQFVKHLWLQGGPLPFKPTVPMPAWSDTAPPINAGGPWSDEHLRTLLTTGKRVDGSRPRPPMPEYQLNAEDVEAVIAYLRSTR